MSRFYVVLPSNSSMDVFPDNKVSSFRVNLPHSLNLDPDKWEVALKEIQFSYSWYNIRRGKNIIIKKVIHSTMELGVQTRIKKIEIPSGYYTNIDKILDVIREHEADAVKEEKVTVEIDSTSKKTFVKIPNYKVELDFNGSDVAKVLGFQPNTVVNRLMSLQSSRGFESELAANIKHATHDSVYLYTDVIKERVVGDFMVPLLRIIPIQNRFGELISMEYSQPHFIDLNRGNINSIEIHIKDDLGDFISFESGKSIVTLIFRRKAVKFYE